VLAQYVTNDVHVDWFGDRRLPSILDGRSILNSIHNVTDGESIVGGRSDASQVLVGVREYLRWLSTSDGATRTFGLKTDDPYVMGLVASADGAREYVLTFPKSTDLADPKARIRLFKNHVPDRLWDVGKLPRSLLYADKVDTVYLLREDSVEQLGGPGFSLPTVKVAHPELAEEDSCGDVDSDGKYLYVSASRRDSICKVRLADGAVVDGRKLAFHPAHMAVFLGKRYIVLTDRPGGKIVRIKAF
jgi:hypothetical protein